MTSEIAEIEEISEIPEIDPESEWYVNFTCKRCNREGTAIMEGRDMELDEEGDEVPNIAIHCWSCLSDKIDFDEIREFN